MRFESIKIIQLATTEFYLDLRWVKYVDVIYDYWILRLDSNWLTISSFNSLDDLRPTGVSRSFRLSQPLRCQSARYLKWEILSKRTVVLLWFPFPLVLKIVCVYWKKNSRFVLWTGQTVSCVSKLESYYIIYSWSNVYMYIYTIFFKCIIYKELKFTYSITFITFFCKHIFTY